ncbi:hypothetical protein PG993_013620 [Apiospora rasikravindrae]|uniref:Non-haem dioxygenase N-terminal domain-containing protein n=1 Tax=Apiospora rasikravindrae TaxID=990691 RepID=A0ABR1RQN4_9PEZI
MGLPTIDISLFYEFDDPSRQVLYEDPLAERTKAIKALLASLAAYGGFKIVGHGIPGNTIQRVFNSSVEFFSLHKHIKNSAAGSRHKNGRLRGYWGRGMLDPNVTDLVIQETFVAAPATDRQAPTPWPIGVRGDILQMTMQPFPRDCANLHHDLLHILEEALGLWNNELVSRWPSADGEVHCTHHPVSRPATTSQLEALVSQIENRDARLMLALGFQDGTSEEILVVCGATVRKRIQARLGTVGEKSRIASQTGRDGQHPKYSVSYIGYENSAVYVT